MELSQQNLIILLACLLFLALTVFLYKRYKQTQKLQKLRRSIHKYFSKNQIVFKTPSGDFDQNASDRMKTGDTSTNEAFSGIFQETQISEPSTKQTTMDMSIDEDEEREAPDFKKVFEQSESRPKKSKLRNRLANKAKVVNQDKKGEENQFQNLDADDEIAIE